MKLEPYSPPSSTSKADISSVRWRTLCISLPRGSNVSGERLFREIYIVISVVQIWLRIQLKMGLGRCVVPLLLGQPLFIFITFITSQSHESYDSNLHSHPIVSSMSSLLNGWIQMFRASFFLQMTLHSLQVGSSGGGKSAIVRLDICL